MAADPGGRTVIVSPKGDAARRAEYERDRDITILLEVLGNAAYFDPRLIRTLKARLARGAPPEGLPSLDPNAYVPIQRWAAKALLEELTALILGTPKGKARGRHARAIERYRAALKDRDRWEGVNHFYRVCGQTLNRACQILSMLFKDSVLAGTPRAIRASFNREEALRREGRDRRFPLPDLVRELLYPESFKLSPESYRQAIEAHYASPQPRRKAVHIVRRGKKKP